VEDLRSSCGKLPRRYKEAGFELSAEITSKKCRKAYLIKLCIYS